MSTSKDSKTLDHFISQVIDKPQVFFGSNQKIADSALEMAKHFYDNLKKVEKVQFSPFTELLTEGFDNDQIWEEIASQNRPFLDYAKTTLKSFNKKPKQKQTYSEEESESEGSMDINLEQDQEDEEMQEFDPEQIEEEDDEEIDQDSVLDQASESDQEILGESEEKKPKKASKKTSEVDDEFFNLDEFNKWTDQQEELDMLSDREDQGNEFDFDNNLDEMEDSDEEEEDDDEDDEATAADLTYNDFFKPIDQPRGKRFRPMTEEHVSEEEEQISEEEGVEEDAASESSVRDLFAAEDSEDDQDGQEKSTFQKQQDRLQTQIEEFEEENVQEKHWTLRGEAAAKTRPVNSLLEEDLEFEHANKPVPVITQESTNTLEDMIKKRILDNMFDDVERKVDPTLRPFVPSKRVEISDEKAKQSLADIYEDDYVSKKSGVEKVDARDEALEKEHGEITELFNTLCYKLDALSNFHYTPKAPKPEMTIVSNAAAISMEEVTPVNVSDATLLAPEEVYDKKKSDVKATTEMDQDERKRLRAQKKKMKRKELALKEREMKVIQKYNPRAGQRQEKKKAVKELLGSKNVTVIGKDGQQKSTSKAVTSASLF